MLLGRRLPDGWNDGLPQPGDYWQRDTHWLACAPDGQLANLDAHIVVEHLDKTITVSPSILCETPGEPGRKWHGYLRRGVWLEDTESNQSVHVLQGGSLVKIGGIPYCTCEPVRVLGATILEAAQLREKEAQQG